MEFKEEESDIQSRLHFHTDFGNDFSPVRLRRQPRKKTKYSFELSGSSEERSVSSSTNFANIPSQNNVRIPGLNSRSVHTLPQRSLNTDISTRSSSHTPSIVASIVEGRGLAKGEIGLAIFDLTGSVLFLSQFSDDYSYHRLMAKLDVYQPVEIIMPFSFANPRTSIIAAQIKRRFAHVVITGVERRFFNEPAGLDYIKKLCSSDFETLEVAIRNKYYCLSAAAALIRFVEHIQNMLFIDKSLQVEYCGYENTTIIDFATARSLEIIVNQSKAKSNETLFGLLNFTSTRNGSRLLRATIMEPPCDEATIQVRLDCVEELLTNQEILPQLKHILEQFPDIDHLISVLIQNPTEENDKSCEKKIDAIIMLRSVVEMVPLLKTSLEYLKNQLFECHKDLLSNTAYEQLRVIISEIILDECKLVNGVINAKTQKCYAIRSNICEGLEVARKTFQERTDDITVYQEQLRDKYNLHIQLGYTLQHGYYLFFNDTESNISVRKLPHEFRKVTKKGKHVNFTTEELVKRNTRVAMSFTNVLDKCANVVNELISKMREHVVNLQRLTSVLSYIDLFVCFAEAAVNYGLVKPSFGNHTEITNGWHPILGKNQAEFVRNNTIISRRKNFALITGPNMSGKSTYLKQIALLQIMAQSGSFVAAEKAISRLRNQICSRLGTNDDIQSNSSTFMIEMKETFYIIQNFRRDALIIIDELGRGTSREEGLGLCFSVAENLIQSGALTFFVTHFPEIYKLAEKYPTVFMQHFTFEYEGNQVILSHKLAAGMSPKADYAIKLASSLDIHPEVVTEAKKLWPQFDTPIQVNDDIDEHTDFGIGSFLLELRDQKEMLADELGIFATSLVEE